MGTLGYIEALHEMLAAQPGSQMCSMDSKSPPGLEKLGLPESVQPVHLQASIHGVVVGTGLTVVVVTGVAVDVVVVVVTVVVDTGGLEVVEP